MTPDEREEARYHEAMRTLLRGTCGVNAAHVSQQTGLSRGTIRNFMAARDQTEGASLHAIGMFLWRTLNAHLLICEEDRRES